MRSLSGRWRVGWGSPFGPGRQTFPRRGGTWSRRRVRRGASSSWNCSAGARSTGSPWGTRGRIRQRPCFSGSYGAQARRAWRRCGRCTVEGFVRPLIEIGRAEVREYLAGRGIPWREDSSNADLRFDRNRIRHQLLPSLTLDWNPGIEETLAGVARVAADEEAYWEGEIERLSAGRLVAAPPALLFPVEWLKGLPQGGSAPGDPESHCTGES